jgi:hypothetical protein
VQATAASPPNFSLSIANGPIAFGCWAQGVFPACTPLSFSITGTALASGTLVGANATFSTVEQATPISQTQNSIDGHATVIATDGDELFIHYSGTSPAPVPDSTGAAQLNDNLPFTITGGTGLFAGAAGSGRLISTGVVYFDARPSAVSAEYTGTISAPGFLAMGPQAMEGNLIVTPGTTLEVGYDFTIPGSHPATTVTLANTQVVFQGACTSGGAAVTITMPIATQSYVDAANSSSWYPSGDQHSPLVYEGAVAVPDLCGGGSIRLAAGGTFTTQVFSDVPVPGNGIHVRWHYTANGTSGSWSGTAAVQPGSP